MNIPVDSVTTKGSSGEFTTYTGIFDNTKQHKQGVLDLLTEVVQGVNEKTPSVVKVTVPDVILRLRARKLYLVYTVDSEDTPVGLLIFSVTKRSSAGEDFVIADSTYLLSKVDGVLDLLIVSFAYVCQILGVTQIVSETARTGLAHKLKTYKPRTENSVRSFYSPELMLQSDTAKQLTATIS